MEEIKKNGNGDEENLYLESERIRIGNRIKSIREKDHVSAKTLAVKANIDKGNLSRIENGKYSVGLDTLNKLALSLDMKLDFINKECQPNKELKLDQNQRLKTKYITEASRYFKSKMYKLEKDADFRRDDTFHTHVAVNHIMYKLGTLLSNDGRLGYEFLIEYKVTEPRVGIYYGCKGLIFDDNDRLGSERLDYEWNQCVRPRLCKILNNTFPEKEFDFRFKATDNVNDHTYWPFWITLNEDEDILDVAALATKLIRNVYKQELDLKEKDVSDDIKNRKKIKVKTAFTQEAYKESLELLENIANNESRHIVVSLFNQFIENAVNQKYLCRDCEYELAWIIAESSGLDFAFLVAAFFDYLRENEKLSKSIRTAIKWQCFTNVILNKNGDYFGDNLARQYSNAKDYNNFEALQKNAKISLYKILNIELPK